MSAQDEQAFLDAILMAPDDDTPRLVYADWLDERGAGDDAARAAFVRAQCRLEHVTPTSKEGRELTRRVKALLKEHEADWAKRLTDLGFVRKWEFRRGFLHRVEMRATQFAHDAKQVFAAAPTVRAARFPEASNEVSRGLAACPELARLAAVDLSRMCSCGHCPIHNDLRALFASKHITGLTALNIAGDRMDEAGAARLARSAGLANLRELDVSDNLWDWDGVAALAKAKHLTRLETLDLSVNEVWERGAAELAKLTTLPALKHLKLRSTGLGPGAVEALIAWPQFARLESLDLAGNPIGPAGARALAALPPDVALKHLDVRVRHGRHGRITAAAARLLKKRFGKGVKV